METSPKRVVVAMSGGVDSSVAAHLLVQQGYEVIGMMMRLWNEDGRESVNRCCTPDSMSLARRVAAKLGIQFYVIDAKEVFYNSVVQYFIEGYLQGTTPNPCLVCNRKIRWEFLLEKAKSIGADYMATGHYARIRKTNNGQYQLLKAVDELKDQSYVLHVMDQYRLEHALFPLGELTKPEVRKIAGEAKLPVADRPESQDLCFLGDEDYRDFLQRNANTALQPGPILNVQGQVIGQHQGLPFYTIGQRKGLGVASPEPLYVIAKSVEQNSIVIGPKEQLGKNELTARKVHWINGEIPVQPFSGTVKIRYKSAEVPALVTPLDSDSIHIQFYSALRDITPGQAAVIYNDQVCLGGGIIQ
jgi:tRNA-uridine 2-sulfurtransferase